jgi:hypothetical protein
VIEPSGHALYGHRHVALEGDAAPREVVDAGEHSNWPPVHQTVGEEVHRPAVVQVRCLRERHSRRLGGPGAPLATNHQDPRAVHPVDALVVHVASVTAEQRRDPPVAERWTLVRVLEEPSF